jgi:hypothetical protein
MLGIKRKLNFKNKKTAIAVIFLSLAVLLLLGNYVLAQETNVGGLTSEFAAQAGFGTTDIRITIANIIRIFLGLLGIIATVIILYGGFIYMTAAGNEEKITKAKRILRDAIIGLLIILTSFGITQFIIGQLQGATGLGGPGGGVGGPGGSALGAGPIESHYPARNATGIPRNTNIIITFKEGITASDIINNQGTPAIADDIITDKIKVCKLADCANGIYIPNDKIHALATSGKVFTFDPVDLLGDASSNISYKVLVDGSIRKANGKNLFLGVYDWQFEVSTIIDVTPPVVRSVIPVPDSVNPRNTIIQINFNEGINPVTASGSVQVNAQGQVTSTFKNMVVEYEDGAVRRAVPGKFIISNQYRTVEFLADEPCKDASGNIMRNSCGGNVFCLAGNKNFIVTIKTAALASEPPAALLPANGITDLTNNSLDGNNDGTAQGPASEYNFGLPDNAENKAKGDNVIWHFKTDNTIDLTPPEINQVAPEVGAGVATAKEPASPLRPIRIYFSKQIMSSTLKGDSNYTFIDTDGVEKPDPFEYVTLIQPDPPVGYTGNVDDWKALNWVGYWLGKEDGDFNGDSEPDSAGVMNHGQLLEFSDYNVRVGSGVKDIHQNCFFPSPGPGCITPQGTLSAPSCEVTAQ